MSDPGGILALEAVDGATVTLERFPIVVGRLVAGDPVPDVDVGHLDQGGRVGPAHCRLTPDGAAVLVHDLGSPSGTWVDGTRVRPGHPRPLGLGRVLRVGDVRLTLVRFSEPDQTLVPEPAAAGPVTIPGGPAALPPSGWEPGAGPAPAPAPAPGGGRPSVPPPPSLAGGPGRGAAAEMPSPDAPFPEGPAPERSLPAMDAGTAPGESLRETPAAVRRWLDAGAKGVRLVAGEPALVVRGAGWAPEGPTLTVAAVETAIAEARRTLGLRDGRPAGSGRAAGLLFEWAVPPLTRAAYLAAERQPRQPVELGPAVAAALATHLGRGQSLLVVAPWTAPILAALAAAAPASARPRAVPAQADAWWVPGGWPVFAGVPELTADIDTLLAGGLAIVERPSTVELRRLMARARHGQGALVVGVEAVTLQAGLEWLAQALWTGGSGADVTAAPAEEGAAAAARAFPAVLTATGSAFELLAVAGADGGWDYRQLGSDDRA